MRGTPVIPPRQEFGRRQILAWIRSLFRQCVFKQAQRNSELFRDRFEKHTEFAGANNTARSNMYPGHRIPTDNSIYGERMGKVRDRYWSNRDIRGFPEISRGFHYSSAGWLDTDNFKLWLSNIGQVLLDTENTCILKYVTKRQEGCCDSSHKILLNLYLW